VGLRAGLDGQKIPHPPGFDPLSVHPIVSRYIPTELPGPRYNISLSLSYKCCIKMLLYFAWIEPQIMRDYNHMMEIYGCM
jgi:hypothetical protein